MHGRFSILTPLTTRRPWGLLCQTGKVSVIRPLTGSCHKVKEKVGLLQHQMAPQLLTPKSSQPELFHPSWLPRRSSRFHYKSLSGYQPYRTWLKILFSLARSPHHRITSRNQTAEISRICKSCLFFEPGCITLAGHGPRRRRARRSSSLLQDIRWIESGHPSYESSTSSS